MMAIVVRLILVGILITQSSISSAQSIEELTWKDCLSEAAKNHPDLIAAQEDVVQAKAAKTVVTSDRFPQINADAGVSTRDSDSGSSKSFSYGLSGTQLIFDGLKTENNVRAAMEGIKAAGESFRFASSDVRFRLRTAFINLLKTQELLNLTQEIYDIRKNNLELIALRYESGTEHRGALLTARANLSQAAAEINQAKRGLETAQRQLIKEMGRREFAPLTVKGDFQIGDPVLEKPDLEALTKDHPSLLRIIAQRNAASFDAKATERDYWPEISVNGDIGETGSEWPPSDSGTSAGLSVSVPIFEGGARGARIAQSKSVYRQLEQQERSVRDGVILALERNWGGFQDAVENVNVQEGFLTAAQERSKISEQQYSVGLISFDNWTIIEDDLVRNKKSYLDAQANALLAEANWIQAKGETLE